MGLDNVRHISAQLRLVCGRRAGALSHRSTISQFAAHPSRSILNTIISVSSNMQMFFFSYFLTSSVILINSFKCPLTLRGATSRMATTNIGISFSFFHVIFMFIVRCISFVERRNAGFLFLFGNDITASAEVFRNFRPLKEMAWEGYLFRMYFLARHSIKN